MKRIAFHVNAGKRHAGETASHLRQIAQVAGLEVVETDEVGTLPRGSTIDCVVVLGGDGTMLSAMRKHPDVPLLGLNLGSLGFLSAVEEPQFEYAIQALARGEYTLSSRTTLMAPPAIRALNDVVVSRGVSGHVGHFVLALDGKNVAEFTADGIVVATPTGSTAYSLSAGGPILLPETRCFCITPICPHALSSRPITVPDSVKISIRAQLRDGSDMRIFADGEDAGCLAGGAELCVMRGEKGVSLVRLKGYDSCENLSRKLGWGVRNTIFDT